MSPAVVVVGDSMLDRYWGGLTDRLSPEAPVPVLLRKTEECRPGGAANVALNIKRLGCSVKLVTMIGADDAGHALYQLMPGIEMRVHEVPSTTEKIRAVTKRHHLLRIDIEREPPPGSAEAVSAMALQVMPRDGIMVLSDYAKGSLVDCQRVIRTAGHAHCRTLVDPKGKDFTRYAGAWLLKPNEDEFEAIVGPWRDDSQMAHKALELRKALHVEHLLITRGDRGMALFSAHERISFEAKAREVFDVSGAGDTVIATLAAMLARGDELHVAVRMANRAAGIVVGRFGTSAVTLEDLGLRQP